jgi:hypothetical protein
MRDLALQLAGVLAIMTAVVHGILGETKVFAKARIEPAWAERLVRAVWHCGAVARLGGGILLFVSPSLSAEPARRWIAIVFAVVYGSGAIANAWATHGRHYGWVALSVIVALALIGA